MVDMDCGQTVQFTVSVSVVLICISSQRFDWLTFPYCVCIISLISLIPAELAAWFGVASWSMDGAMLKDMIGRKKETEGRERGEKAEDGAAFAQWCDDVGREDRNTGCKSMMVNKLRGRHWERESREDREREREIHRVMTLGEVRDRHLPTLADCHPTSRLAPIMPQEGLWGGSC